MRIVARVGILRLNSAGRALDLGLCVQASFHRFIGFAGACQTLRRDLYSAASRPTFHTSAGNKLSSLPPATFLSSGMPGQNLRESHIRFAHQKAKEDFKTEENTDKTKAEIPVKETAQTAVDHEPRPEIKLGQRERLKRAVREYGATVIVFHTTISLFTLGVSYAIVSSGVDVVGLLSKLGVGQSILESKIATGASTFVVTYALHKVFAPARMACTLTATPFIVRYLRRIGFLKTPVSKS